MSNIQAAVDEWIGPRLREWFPQETIRPQPDRYRYVDVVPFTIVAPVVDTTQQEFELHADKWMRETAHISSITKQILHPSYQRIMAMGTPVLPYILRALRDRPLFWFHALTHIVGEDIASAIEPGDIRGMQHAWLRWGRDRGLI